MTLQTESERGVIFDRNGESSPSALWRIRSAPILQGCGSPDSSRKTQPFCASTGNDPEKILRSELAGSPQDYAGRAAWSKKRLGGIFLIKAQTLLSTASWRAI